MEIICYLSNGYPTIEASYNMAVEYADAGCRMMEVDFPSRNPYLESDYIAGRMKKALEACDDYYKQTGRRVTFEYSLVAGVNDGPDDVKELTGILKHRNCHLNLIPVNPIKERNFKKPDSKKAMEFQNKLEKNGINVTIRRERGSDIDGACGQLRRRYGAVKEERPDEDICED